MNEAFPWSEDPPFPGTSATTRSLYPPFELCKECRGRLSPSSGTAALITHWFTSPVVPAGFRLPVALSLSLSSSRLPRFSSAMCHTVHRTVWFPVLFSLSPAPEVPSPPFPRKTVPDSPDTEFAVYFIITLDGNKLSKRCACARDAGGRTRYSVCFYNTVYINRTRKIPNQGSQDKSDNNSQRLLQNIYVWYFIIL